MQDDTEWQRKVKKGGRMLFLREANLKDAHREWEFVREMPEDENGFCNSWNGITEEDFMKTALPRMLAFAKGEDLPEGYVPETFFFLWDGETIVDVVLWMGDEYTPSHHSFEFPWRLMNVRNELLPEEYSKWRKAEDERLAARKAAKDKYWAEVRAKYLAEHPGENSL